MSPAPTSRLRRFFEAYALASLTGDTDAVAGAYFSTYVSSSPAGAEAFAVDQDFRTQLADRSEVMKGLGLSDLTTRVRRARTIADGHFMVDVDWEMAFGGNRRTPVISNFTQSYVVREWKGDFQILCYISHEDEAEVMKRDGIV
jgi:hypothetical protein